MILLDMDGVVVDFVSGALRLHGLKRPEPVAWNFYEQLGLSADDFYAPMGPAFWADLHWTQEGRDLLRELEARDEIVLCTSPLRTRGCVEGKERWIRKHAPEYWNRVAFLGEKFLLAGAGTLIDDSEANVEAFRAAGGRAILVGREWNSGGVFDLDAILRSL